MNSKFWFGMTVLAMAGIISVVAGYFSIVGLIALFAAHGTAVAVMGGSLEAGKLVASGWLKLNWSNPRLNFLHRAYLMLAVVMLMVITSIGIYGFLAAGHLEQQAPMAGLNVQSQQIEMKIAQTESQNKRIEARLNQIDQNIAVFLKNDQASRGLKASGALKVEREQLQKTLEANNQQINTLNDKLVPLKMQSSAVEAKLGPIKYVGAAFGWSDSESAVRFVIIILMTAFDPLAVILMLSGIITLREWSLERGNRAEELPEPEPETTVVEAFVGPEVVAPEPEPEAPEPEPEPEPQTERYETVSLPVIDPLPVAAVDPEPTIVVDPVIEDAPKELSREDVIAFLELNPGIVSELAQIVEEKHERELSDREKLLDLLEKNPAIINDMAEIIAAQIARPDTRRWLG